MLLGWLGIACADVAALTALEVWRGRRRAVTLRFEAWATPPRLTAPRSSGWRKERNEHLRLFPFCACCGSDDHLEVHHCEPFHERPDLELDPSNLITLCEGRPVCCHYNIGHLGISWKAWNPHVREDAALLLRHRRNFAGIEHLTIAEIRPDDFLAEAIRRQARAQARGVPSEGARVGYVQLYQPEEDV